MLVSFAAWLALFASQLVSEDLPIAQVQSAMGAGSLSAVRLSDDQLGRIEALDRRGPQLRSLAAINPQAGADARKLDAERAAGQPRGPLHGVTLAVKDLIDVKGMATTGGSLALVDNVANADATAVARLRAAGVVILAKANTSEWAHARSSRPIAGFSGVGGLTRNPYVLDREAGFSSTGTAVAVSAGLVTAGIGTDTDGSVTTPAAQTGIVGLRPTVGLISRAGVIPFSYLQDTIGPMGRSVADVAALLTPMVAADPADPTTLDAARHAVDFAAALRPDSLKGVRVGVMRFAPDPGPATRAVFEAALKQMSLAGAVLVEIDKPPPEPDAKAWAQMAPLTGQAESHARYDAYLASTNSAVRTRSLAELVAFNRAHAAEELGLFGQEFLEGALAAPPQDPTAESLARAKARQAFVQARIEGLLNEYDVAVLIAPTLGPAARIDVVNRPAVQLGGPGVRAVSSYAAQAGFPHLTVPMGQVSGLPVGLSFIGPAYSDARLLSYGFAFEQATHARRPPTFIPSLESTPDIEKAMSPHGPPLGLGVGRGR